MKNPECATVGAVLSNIGSQRRLVDPTDVVAPPRQLADHPMNDEAGIRVAVSVTAAGAVSVRTQGFLRGAAVHALVVAVALEVTDPCAGVGIVSAGTRRYRAAETAATDGDGGVDSENRAEQAGIAVGAITMLLEVGRECARPIRRTAKRQLVDDDEPARCRHSRGRAPEKREPGVGAE
jgi:hypothetical protein